MSVHSKHEFKSEVTSALEQNSNMQAQDSLCQQMPAGKCLEPESAGSVSRHAADVPMYTLHPKQERTYDRTPCSQCCTSAQQGPRGSPMAALRRDRRGSFCHVAECRQCRQRCASVSASPVSMAVCQIQSEHPLQPSAVLLLHFGPVKALPN